MKFWVFGPFFPKRAGRGQGLRGIQRRLAAVRSHIEMEILLESWLARGYVCPREILLGERGCRAIITHTRHINAREGRGVRTYSRPLRPLQYRQILHIRSLPRNGGTLRADRQRDVRLRGPCLLYMSVFTRIAHLCPRYKPRTLLLYSTKPFRLRHRHFSIITL